MDPPPGECAYHLVGSCLDRLLDDPATFVLAGQSADGRLVAGAVASRSDQVVGISKAAVRHGFEPVGPLRIWLHGL